MTKQMDAKDWIIIRLMVLLLNSRKDTASFIFSAEFRKIAAWVHFNIPGYGSAGEAIRAEKEQQ